MSADDRRASLVAATLPLLRERGRTVSTREIASAAGVAEGTIFRVFDSKDDLVEACIHRTFDNSQVRVALRAIDPGLPLATRLTAAVGIMQARLREIFELMFVLQTTGRPLHPRDAKGEHLARQRANEEIDEDFHAIIGADAVLLRVEPQRLIDTLRMLTLSSVHPLMGGRDSSPADLVDIVLEGALERPTRLETGATATTRSKTATKATATTKAKTATKATATTKAATKTATKTIGGK